MIPVRIVRRFARKQDGAAAVEFALVAAPFLALTFAILETAFIFFAGQTLEAAAADASRLIMTGQAQTAGYSQSAFKTQVCNRIYGLFDCSGGMTVSVKSYSSFSAVDTSNPITNGQLDSTKTNSYVPGGPNCIVVVSLYYQWPLYVTMFSLSALGNLNGSKRLLSATSVFRNEPYGGSGTCT
ncbi:MAG: TadE/TadG family type IV pilus assembly protein [Pseudolabrys sp.]